MAHTASPGGSSTSATRRSPRSPRSGRASPTSSSPGRSREPGADSPFNPGELTPSALRSLAARHDIRPKKSLGQHFLIEPALARRIAQLAGVGPKTHVLEVGAGLGSLTRALAETGAFVLAIEMDRALAPALREAVGAFDRVRVEVADALRVDWGSLLDHPGPWTMAANLPYNVAVPVVMRILEEEPRVERLLIMVQREVGQRLAASPGGAQFGALSLHVAYRAEARVLRKVSRTVFWPQPNVDSVLVSLVRRPPPVDVDEAALWRVVDGAFEQRRKTMRGAMVRLGLDAEEAARALADCEIDPRTRPERLGLPEFACLTRHWLEHDRVRPRRRGEVARE